MVILIPLQPTLCQELPIVSGNVDYEIFRDTLMRIAELIEYSGIDIKAMTYLVEEAEKEGQKNWKGLVGCQNTYAFHITHLNGRM